jgi:ribulose-5-phosphate 4-epimerase/fuculose-1-phosphate aldolase
MPGRFIHGEIYKARPDVNAVIHSHVQGAVRRVTYTEVNARLQALAIGIGGLIK